MFETPSRTGWEFIPVESQKKSFGDFPVRLLCPLWIRYASGGEGYRKSGRPRGIAVVIVWQSVMPVAMSDCWNLQLR